MESKTPLSSSLRRVKKKEKDVEMNPLTQQHITNITLSERGGEKGKVEGWWEVFTVKKPKGNTVNLGKKMCSEGGWERDG